MISASRSLHFCNKKKSVTFYPSDPSPPHVNARKIVIGVTACRAMATPPSALWPPPPAPQAKIFEPELLVLDGTRGIAGWLHQQATVAAMAAR